MQFRHWRFDPDRLPEASRPKTAKERSLCLPFEVTVDLPDSIGARKLLTGTTLQTLWSMFYLAESVAAKSLQDAAGVFNWDAERVAFDLLGAKPTFEMSGGYRRQRVPSHLRNRFKEDFAQLGAWLVCGVGELKVQYGEPLVHRYGEASVGGHVIAGSDLWALARLAWLELKDDFVQLPVSAFRVGADDMPLATGIAHVIRRHVQKWHDAGELILPLETLLRQAGEDVDRGRERHGRAYWTASSERLQRIAHDGGFGSVHVGHDDDGDTAMTLVVSEPLAVLYADVRKKHLAMRGTRTKGSRSSP